MAGKPDLSAGPGVQNVVVYVSNDNFAQAYTVGQQNVPQNAHILHNAAYGNSPPAMSPSLGPPKTFPEKNSVKPPDYSVAQQQGGYFASVGYSNDANYQNGAILKSYGNGDSWQGGPARVREDCDSYVDAGYLGAEGPPHSVRCDSVRSETAESSCSSLSSADEGLVLLQNQPPAEMVVYESGVDPRSGAGVLVALGGPHMAPQTMNSSSIVGTLGSMQKQCVMVPYGWKRLLNNGSIIYISPSNTVLASPEQVKEYLLSAGTCKCGLECHFKYDSVFNFDPKVGSRPWIPMPDTNTGDLTKLCNHKRKAMAAASLDGKPPDHVKLRRAEYNIKRKKRKIGLPYAGGVSVSQILAHREKVALNQHNFNKELVGNPHQVHPQSPVNNPQLVSNRLPSFPASDGHQMLRYPDQTARVMAMGDGTVMLQQAPAQSQSGGHINIQSHQIIGPNGQIINVQGHGQISQMQPPNSGVVVDAQNVVQSHDLHQRIFVDGQPNEPTGPGRPNVQMVPVSVSSQMVSQQRQDMQQRAQQQQQHLQFYNGHPQYQQVHGFDPSKAVRPFGQMTQGFRPHGMVNQQGQIVHQQGQMVPQQGQMVQGPGQHNRMQWHNRMQHSINQHIQMQQQQQPNQANNICERVPPLHQQPPTVWQEEIKRKRVKVGKISKGRPYHVMDGCPNSHAPCPNIDVRQMAAESRAVIINHLPQQGGQGAPSPSFMEDPSGYLAQQTALLNNTINRQTGASGCTSYICSSPGTSLQSPQQHIITVSNAHSNEVNLPSNVMPQQMKLQHPIHNHNMPPKQIQNANFSRNQQQIPQQQYGQVQIQPSNMADSSHVADQPQYPAPCQCCAGDGVHSKTSSRPSSNSSTPAEDPVTSSTYSEKQFDQPAPPPPDPRPIQGGTVSTSNDGASSGPPTPTPPQRAADSYGGYPQQGENPGPIENVCCSYAHAAMSRHPGGLVTTMASGRTHGSNTLTSVLAGRTNTATVSINSPSTVASAHNPATATAVQSQAMISNVSKSPLEMVQSVVSSIQVPPSAPQSGSQMSSHLVKHSPAGLSPGHIFVSSGGQLIMASPGSHHQGGMMAPPPPKIQAGMPPMSVSPMITNVTGAVTQVIPALGQQAVLVNAMPTPFVLQQGVTMTVDGMQNVQLPQLVAGNVLQQHIQLESASDARRSVPALLSPETKKRAKKKKNTSQTVAGMLHLAAQQNPQGMVMSQQGFPQQIQMAHSPQGPVMQALTIVPSKNGGPPQIVMNGQAGLANAQPQLIANSQPAQQINLLQPVNLINGATGVMQNFPAIQQFIVPNLGGSMVMNADGTATILQDASNLGVQLQIQHVNGQNVLTPVQNGSVFGGGGQSILAAGPAGMVIRAPGSQGKIIQHQQQQQQQHSPGAQFVAQFGGQLSPLVAGVSPNHQQVTFGASPQQLRPGNAMQGAQQQQQHQQQEYVQMNGQMGQTLMVPCTPTSNMSGSPSSQRNTTFVQQNTTIVQQQTTMVANNQQLQNFQHNGQQGQQHSARTATVNLEQQNYVISSNDNKQMQVMVQQQQQRDPPPCPPFNYRQSVSTQTAVHQHATVATNAFCQTSTSTSSSSVAASPPDTTTLSPLPTGAASMGGRSPPTTADTTTHAGGSTDDAASPAPSSTCSAGGGDVGGGTARPQSCAMAMVHCVSSSEPDSADLSQQPDPHEWRRSQPSTIANSKPNYGDSSHFGRRSTLVAGLHYVTEQMKSREVVSSRNYEKMIHHKRKSADGVMVMDNHQGHTSLFDEDEGERADGSEGTRPFVLDDLVWGPAEGCPSWPGKLIELHDQFATVKWFGSEKPAARIEIGRLQTLSEGLDAHHQARKKCRTSRKLNSQLEKAIQEAMAELDKESAECTNVEKGIKTLKTYSKVAPSQTPIRKTSIRLKSTQR